MLSVKMAELINTMKEGVTLDSELLAKAVVRLIKRGIFERFTKTGTLSEKDQEFCDSIDWYPVDELEQREEYAEKLKGIAEGEHLPMTTDRLDKLMRIK